MKLTKREQEVMELLIVGKRDREIAEAIGISTRTAQKHVDSACNKMGALTRAQAAAIYVGQMRAKG